MYKDRLASFLSKFRLQKINTRSFWQIELSIKTTQTQHMLTTKKSHRESISFKKNEGHILDSRDALCKHYRLGKSDLIKYLIKKESFNLKNINSTII